METDRTMSSTNGRLISLVEAAGRLGVCPRTMRRLAEAGSVPVVEVGRRQKVDPQQLEAWIADGGVIRNKRGRR